MALGMHCITGRHSCPHKATSRGWPLQGSRFKILEPVAERSGGVLSPCQLRFSPLHFSGFVLSSSLLKAVRMARVVCAALVASAVAAITPGEVLEGLRKASHDERIHAPVIDVSAITPGVRRAGLKSYSTILMHGLGDAGHNPGMHSLAVVRSCGVGGGVVCDPRCQGRCLCIGDWVRRIGRIYCFKGSGQASQAPHLSQVAVLSLRSTLHRVTAFVPAER